MEELRIESMHHAGQLDPTQLKGPHKRCIYDQETLCAMSRTQFAACKSCYRLNPHQAINHLFIKIKKLAAEIFNLPAPEPDQFPLEK